MSTGNADRAREISGAIFAADFIDHDGIEQATHGRESWQRAVIDTVFAAFSDIDVTVEKLLAEGDLVAVRYVFTATHTGSFRVSHPHSGASGTARTRSTGYRAAGSPKAGAKATGSAPCASWGYHRRGDTAIGPAPGGDGRAGSGAVVGRPGPGPALVRPLPRPLETQVR
jgi:hypothetical protein